MEDDRDLSFRLADYHFELPPELIAQTPAPRREDSRLLVLNRFQDTIEHSRFDRIGGYLGRGDLLVVNDTRVVRARLAGRKDSGGRVELLVLDPWKSPRTAADEGYTCLIKTSKRARAGQIIHFQDGTQAKIALPLGDGKAMVRFPDDRGLLDILDRIGEVPLPPYITRPSTSCDATKAAGNPESGSGEGRVDDFARYQTEYAREPGAVAAPTAGLHFSRLLLESLGAEGVRTAAVTLHVGYGTFAPVRCEDIRLHRMHSEHFEVREETAEAVCRAKRDGNRVIAVGTTVARTLEWIFLKAGKVQPLSGSCEHYIYPGYRFGVIDRMVTNFHLPGSSLILLVSAFAGRRGILSAYAEAVRERYRFFSYGDAMLIL